MMGMNTALAQCSNATLANSASNANDRLRTSTGMWSMRARGRGGRGALCQSWLRAGIVRGRLRCIGAEGFLPRRRQAAPGSEGSVGEGCGAVTGAFMRGLWGSSSPLYVGGRLRRNLAAKAFSRAGSG